MMKNKYTKMYLKYIHFMPSILQIHLHINTQQLYFWYTKLKSAKLEQVILYLKGYSTFFFFFGNRLILQLPQS